MRPRGTAHSDASQVRWIKALYMVIYSSYGATSMYRTLYYRRVGLTESQIGVLIALVPLCMLLAGPLWSVVADRFRVRSRLLSLVTGLSVFPMLGMIWIQSFPGLAILNAVHALLMGPIQPLLDSSALAVLGDQKHKYATIRAFGSLGYAPVVWLTGLLIQGHDIRWIFVGNALLVGAGCLLSMRVRTRQAALPTGVGAGLSRLAKNRVWAIYMGAVFVAMAAQGVLFGYISLYLDTLGATESLIGFSGALSSIAQTVLMLAALPRLLRKWGSQRLMLLALSLYTLRLVIWAALPVPAVIVASQVLLGLTYGVVLVASVDFTARHAPAGLATTSQALTTGVVSGLGRSLGGVLAGSLYDGAGPRITFAVFGALTGIASVVFGATWRRQSPDDAIASAHAPPGEGQVRTRRLAPSQTRDGEGPG